MLHALGVRACLAAAGATAPPVTIKLLIEGEEESGSPHFADLLRGERADRLACDVIVVVRHHHVGRRRAVHVHRDARAASAARSRCRGPVADLHSGSFGGGVPNPLHAMAALLAGLHDAGGRVTLPGFYDRVVPLTRQERDLFARLPYDEKHWLAEAGHSQARRTARPGYTTLERIWARPTAEVNGMWGGHTGPGGKTIVPREAHAKVSFRLVADQEPAEVVRGLREYVAAHTRPGIEAEVSFEGPACGRASRRSPRSRFRRASARWSARSAARCCSPGRAAAAPEADLAEILGAPLVFVAVGLDSDRIHAPNEKAEMALLLKGAEAAAYHGLSWRSRTGAEGSGW